MLPIGMHNLPYVPVMSMVPRRRSLTFSELDSMVIQHASHVSSGKSPPNVAYLPQMTSDQRYTQADWHNARLTPELARLTPELTNQRLTPELVVSQRATPDMVRLDPVAVASFLSRHGRSPPPTAQSQALPHLSLSHIPLQVPQGGAMAGGGMYIGQVPVSGITALTQGMSRKMDHLPNNSIHRQSPSFQGTRYANRSPVLGRTSALTTELQKPISLQHWSMVQANTDYMHGPVVYSRQNNAPNDLSKHHLPANSQLMTNNNTVSQNSNMSQLIAALNMPPQVLPQHGASQLIREDVSSLQQQVNSIPPHELNKLMRLLRTGPLDFASALPSSAHHIRDEPSMLQQNYVQDLPETRQSPEPPLLTRVTEALIGHTMSGAADVFADFAESTDFPDPPMAGRLVEENPFFPPNMKLEDDESKSRPLTVPDLLVEDEHGHQVPYSEEEESIVERTNPFSMRVQILSNFSTSAAPSSRYRSQALALHRAKAGCILSAGKSLDLLRQNVQKAINKEIDDLVHRYIEKFFEPACENIRRSQGEAAVNGEHLMAVRRQILDEAKKMYSDNDCSLLSGGGGGGGALAEASDTISEAGSQHDTRKKNTLDVNRRRRHSDSDSEASLPVSRKKMKKGRPFGQSGRATPSKGVKQSDPVKREGYKWNAERVTTETLFVMGSKANKALGLGNTRGRLYIKHPDVFKYSGDQEDKEWLYAQRRMPLTGGKTYILLYDDIVELSKTPEYANTALLMHILQGFSVPDWMVTKIRAQMTALRTDLGGSKASKCEPVSSHGSTVLYGTSRLTPTDMLDGSLDSALDVEAFDLVKDTLPFSSARSTTGSKSDAQASPNGTELDMYSNADEADNSPLAQSQHFDVSPMPDVSPSASDLDGIDDDPPLTAPFDLHY